MTSPEILVVVTSKVLSNSGRAFFSSPHSRRQKEALHTSHGDVLTELFY